LADTFLRVQRVEYLVSCVVGKKMLSKISLDLKKIAKRDLDKEILGAGITAQRRQSFYERK
jgi:hypothetical protein